MRDFANLHNAAWLRARAAEVLLAVAMAPAFAWMNPFISSKQTFVALLGFWGSLLASWFIVMAIVDRALDPLDIVRRMSPPARRATVIALAALPMILIAGAATHALKGWRATPAEIVELYFQIVLVGSGVALIAVAAFAPRSGPAASGNTVRHMPDTIDSVRETPRPPVHQDAVRDSGCRLISRLPSHLRGRILCLEMEDHYVRVHTDRGSGLMLLRLSDAIAEAEAATQGRQVHRSWWVSDEAVEHFERVGRTGQIHLNGGLRAPVSQRYLRSVENVCASKDVLRAMAHLPGAGQREARGLR
jgi:hypothetical protein